MLARVVAPGRWGRDAALVGLSLALASLVLWANREAPATSPDAPVAAARAILKADPLNVIALRDLGLALDREGDRAEAAPLLALAGERSKRDTATGVWLLQRALEAARYEDALARADALLRRDIDAGLRERLYGLLTAAARVAPARAALVHALGLHPWWRESFLRALASKGDPSSGETVLIALSAAGAGPSTDESQAFLVRRTDEGDFVGATRLAARLFGPRALDPADALTPAPVGWSAAQGEGATSSWDEDRLAVTYDGFAAPALPQRLLDLAPGSWSLVFKHRTPDASSPRLKVAVRCAAGRPLTQTPSLPGTPTWRAETLTFTVPASGCEGQWLAIVADPGDRRDPVETDFTAWRIEPSSEPLLR